MNKAKKDPIWNELVTQLRPILGERISLFFPESWTNECLSWYKQIEQSSFRQTLTYSEEEILERLAKDGVIMMFLVLDNHPEGLLLGYSLDGTRIETFYLDTIAVRQRGRGIGPIMMSVLIRWAKKMGYGRIQLDTEAEDEKGIRLSSFYEHFGFRIIEIDDDTGNITMQLDL